MLKLNELEQYFKTIDLSKYRNTRIDQASVVIDAEMFVDSHVTILKANSGNRRMLPFYDRLIKLYNITKNDT